MVQLLMGPCLNKVGEISRKQVKPDFFYQDCNGKIQDLGQFFFYQVMPHFDFS
jgi:hypothetical protein